MIEVLIVLTVAVGIGVAMRLDEAPMSSSARRGKAARPGKGKDRSSAG